VQRDQGAIDPLQDKVPAMINDVQSPIQNNAGGRE